MKLIASITGGVAEVGWRKFLCNVICGALFVLYSGLLWLDLPDIHHEVLGVTAVIFSVLAGAWFAMRFDRWVIDRPRKRCWSGVMRAAGHWIAEHWGSFSVRLMMRYVLFFSGIILLLLGLVSSGSAKTAVQEISGLIVLLIGTVTFVGAFILEAVGSLRRDVRDVAEAVEKAAEKVTGTLATAGLGDTALGPPEGDAPAVLRHRR